MEEVWKILEYEIKVQKSSVFVYTNNKLHCVNYEGTNLQVEVYWN